ncbi:MAG: hypothetical protein BWY57_03435 [Betaproteobacteria bacterium ADurb.Bin341]|nr:MAG: hypothetical protein BWY57_03435 [Betaproteobacteria bacterium ADurb.Bin341]
MLSGGLQGMGGGSSSSQAGQQFGNSIFGAMRGGDDEEADSPGGIRALGGIFGKAGKMFGGKPNLPTAPNTPTATLPMTPGIDAQPRFTGNVQVPEGPSLLGQSGANVPNLSMEDILLRQKMDRQIPAILGDTERIAQVQSDILNPVSVSNQQGSIIPERNVPRPMIPRLPGQKGPQIEYDPRNPVAVREDARYDFVTDRPGRNWKTSLQNAILGGARAYQANPNAGWGNIAGGALGGGLGATFNPTEGRNQIFEATQLPRINENIKGQESFEDRQLKQRGIEADTRRAEAMARRADADAGRYVGEAAWGTYDTRTGQPIWQRPQGQTSGAAPRRYNVNGALVDETGRVLYQSPEKEKPISVAEAEAQRAAEEGSVEEIAASSYEGRGGDDYVKSKLPPMIQSILNTGMVKEGGVEREATPQEVMAAQRQFEQAIRQQRQADERYTRGEAKKNAATRRSDRPAPMGSKGPTGPTMKMSAAVDILRRAAGEK